MRVDGQERRIYSHPARNKSMRKLKKEYILITILLLIAVFVVACQINSDKSLYNWETAERSTEELEWEWIIEPDDYQVVRYLNSDLVEMKISGEKYILIDAIIDTVITFEYVGDSEFSEGTALIRDNDKVFFIDGDDKYVSYDPIPDGFGFEHDLYSVKKDGLWGFINKFGELMIEHKFEAIRYFREDFAAVKKDDKWGFIDKSGNIVIKNEFDDVGHFNEVNNFNEGLVAVKKDDKWGFIDKSGKIVADFQYDLVRYFQEGYAAVMKDGKWGFIDKKGNVRIDLKYDDVGNFSEGKAAVKVAGYTKDYSDSWAYIDENDKVVIDFYSYYAEGISLMCVGEFKAGLAFVSKGYITIIDYKGNDHLFSDSGFFISQPDYNFEYDAIPAYTYLDDTMITRKYGLVGLDKEQRLDPAFDYIYGVYENGFAVVEEWVGEDSFEYKTKTGVIKVFEVNDDKRN